jgi:ribosomal protein S18 acetylase RimI-like enzyme
MSGASIRLATSADEPSIFRLLAALMEDEPPTPLPIQEWSAARAVFRELLTSERGSVIVCEIDAEVLGVVTTSYVTAIRYGGSYARMEELIVDDRARGTGAGTLLVAAAIKEAERRGCKLITLYSREHNRGFYEKNGFRYVAPELHRTVG